MGKSVYIAEKPSVAQEFAKALHTDFKRKDGYEIKDANKEATQQAIDVKALNQLFKK